VSKFLLNLLVQISKSLIYSKIQFLSEKNFSSTFSSSGHFGPERPSRPSRPTRPRPPLLPPSPSRRHRRLLLSRRRAAPIPRHGKTPTDAPLLNSVACLYSVVNPPSSLRSRRTRPHSPPLLSELELHHLRAPLLPPICRRCLTVTPPNEPG
jgi:hypothetical protein